MSDDPTRTRRTVLRTTSAALASATGGILLSGEATAADDTVELADSVYYTTRDGYDVEFVSEMTIYITEGAAEDEIDIDDSADAYVHDFDDYDTHEFTDCDIALDRGATDFYHSIETTASGTGSSVSYFEYSEYTGNLTSASINDSFTATVDGSDTWSYDAKDSYDL